MFWHVIIKAQETKKWTDQLDVIKSKTFPFFKGHYQKSERQSEWGENVCTSYISGKISVPRIYEELLQTNDKKKTQLKTGQSTWLDAFRKNWHACKDDTRIVKKYMRRHSTLLVIRQMQIKITMWWGSNLSIHHKWTDKEDVVPALHRTLPGHKENEVMPPAATRMDREIRSEKWEG